MDGDRTQSALLRIDAALARLEAAASRPAPQVDGELVSKHDKLRQAVTATLVQIDRMIAKQSA